MTIPPLPAYQPRDFTKLPESVMRPGNVPEHRRPRLVTPLYGSLRSSFSGSTWYLAQAGMAEGLFEGAFTLNTVDKLNLRLQATGAIWKLWRILQLKKHGGFKFVRLFHDVLWSQYIDQLENTLIINNTQIYSDVFLRKFKQRNIVPCFYIDGTLSEYIYGYGEIENQTIGGDMVRRAIAMEQESYAHAARIMVMSQSTAHNLVEVYGVEPNRITVIAPGANLDDAAVPPPSSHKGWRGQEFTLGFVGLYPMRKGLGKLATAVRILRSRGLPIRLRVIGRCPDEIATMDGVDFLGTIDKATAADQFVDILRTVDLGCQMSQKELLGIAVLEFMRVGVPVIATHVGGMPDVLADGGGILVPPDVTAEQLSEELCALMMDIDRYNELRAAAIRRSSWTSWRRTAGEIDATLKGMG